MYFESLNRTIQTTQQLFPTHIWQKYIFRCLEKVEGRHNLPMPGHPLRIPDSPSGEGDPTEG